MTELNLIHVVPGEYENLEVGAGCGTFGNKFVPKCYITEKYQNTCEVSYIHYFCDAADTKIKSKSFKEIFACNPFNYGFRNMEDGELLLRELTRLLKENGKIYFLTSTRNKYCVPERVLKAVESLNKKNGNNSYICKVYDTNPEYLKHDFYLESHLAKTIPSKTIEIYAA